MIHSYALLYNSISGIIVLQFNIRLKMAFQIYDLFISLILQFNIGYLICPIIHYQTYQCRFMIYLISCPTIQISDFCLLAIQIYDLFYCLSYSMISNFLSILDALYNLLGSFKVCSQELPVYNHKSYNSISDLSLLCWPLQVISLNN